MIQRTTLYPIEVVAEDKGLGVVRGRAHTQVEFMSLQRKELRFTGLTRECTHEHDPVI